MHVAALFVAPDSVYRDLDCDTWDELRDARGYAGQLPVIAHPPCQRWSQLGVAAYARHGGEHNRPGNDSGCFASALQSVRRWDGVLEHPAKSLAWGQFELVRPGKGWTPIPPKWHPHAPTEWVCEVWQSAYGHQARKATWLLYSSRAGHVPPELDWTRLPGTHQVGWQDRRGKARNRPTLSKQEANATPIAFAKELIALALHARGT